MDNQADSKCDVTRAVPRRVPCQSNNRCSTKEHDESGAHTYAFTTHFTLDHTSAWPLSHNHRITHRVSVAIDLDTEIQNFLLILLRLIRLAISTQTATLSISLVPASTTSESIVGQVLRVLLMPIEGGASGMARMLLYYHSGFELARTQCIVSGA